MKTRSAEWCHVGGPSAPARPCQVNRWGHGDWEEWEIVARVKPEEVTPHLGSKVPIIAYVTGRGLCAATAFVRAIYMDGTESPDCPWPATVCLVGSDPLTPA